MTWPKKLYVDGEGRSLDLLQVNDTSLSSNEARYGKEPHKGHWAVTVQRGGGIYQILIDDPITHLAGRLLKEKKMFREEKKTLITNVKEESIDVSLITVGRLVYVNLEEVISRFVPKLTWYEKLFTSRSKREIAQLVGVYIALQALRTKYDHYLIQAVTAHINFELQTKLIGGVSQEVIDKIFTKLESK